MVVGLGLVVAFLGWHSRSPGSPHNASVAAAIEDRLPSFRPKFSDRRRFGLAAVDRGPVMKEVLLESLLTPLWPHWATEALAEYFGDEPEARLALRSVLMGEPVHASRIAEVATRVLAPAEVVLRLMAILRGPCGQSGLEGGTVRLRRFGDRSRVTGPSASGEPVHVRHHAGGVNLRRPSPAEANRLSSSAHG